MATPLILDTDIGTDVDDALALAFALRHPALDLRAVTTVSGDTRRRALIAAKLLRIAGRGDIEVAAGEAGEQTSPTRSAEAGHENAMLGDAPYDLAVSDRDAVTLLLETCDASPTTVATVGMQSNIAVALERDAGFADDVGLLAVMGGVFAPVRFLESTLPASVDHNLNVDQRASLRALNAGIRALYVPCDVTFSTWITTDHLDALWKGDALCRELARQAEIWSVAMRRRGRGIIPDDHVALLHDPLTVACLTDEGRRFVRTERLPVTVAMHNGVVRTFIDRAEGVEAEVVTGVDAPGFARFWLETVLG
jgi:purine nucleosidase